jgi:hypothetical protein
VTTDTDWQNLVKGTLKAERPFEKLARPGSDEAERPCRRFRRG